MLEHLKELVVILFFAVLSFWGLGIALSVVVNKPIYKQWRNAWFIIVSIAFVAPSIWVFFIAASFVLFTILPGAANRKVFLFFVLLCALPNIHGQIPGFGAINYLIELSYPRFLILILLGSALVFERTSNRSRQPRSKVTADTIVMLFLLLNCLLFFRDESFTHALRQCVIALLGIAVPYYAVSRVIKEPQDFKYLLAAILVSVLPLSLIGLFESGKHWLLYTGVMQTLSDLSGITRYDVRAGTLRAATVFFSPIVFGFVLIIGFGALLYLKPLLRARYSYLLIASSIIVTLLATVSRGPWIGFGLMLVVYYLLSRPKLKHLVFLPFITAILLPLVLLTPAGKGFIELLPFVGSVRADTISYRQELFNKSLVVIKQNPLLGSTTYLETPEMESMRQGQGIIDIVNTYLQVALETGLVGLTLFTGIFASLMLTIYRQLRLLPPTEADLLRLGRVILSTLLGIMVTIGTVSSIDYIPYWYWSYAGIGAAYVRLANRKLASLLRVKNESHIVTHEEIRNAF